MWLVSQPHPPLSIFEHTYTRHTCRHQFPTPTRQGIPAWQRAGSIPGSTPPPFSSPSSKLPVINGPEHTNGVEDSEGDEARPGLTGTETGATGPPSNKENGILDESPQEWHDAN